MRISIRTKLALTYLAIILLAMLVVGGLTQSQLKRQSDPFINNRPPQNASQNIQSPAPRPPSPIERGKKLLDTLENSIWLTFLGVGALSILLSILIANVITQPLQKVRMATEEIAAGNYKKRLPVTSNDELGDLMASVNAMAQDLEDHHLLQRQLITDLSHELGTPLTNIKGYLEALIDEVIQAPRDRKATLELIQKESGRLEKMLHEIRELARIQKPAFTIHRKKSDVSQITQEIIEQMKPQIESKKIVLHTKGINKKLEANIDPDRYRQIVLNLLSNAIKFSPNKSKVTVELMNEKDGFTLSVQDEGEGISKHDLPYIFERFYRGDPSRSNKTDGLGIGLTIAKELVEAHGGKIEVKSEVKKGTTFRCYFQKNKN